MQSPLGAAPATAPAPAPADQLATALCRALAQGHGIDAHEVTLGDCVVVSLWLGVTARCGGGLIWWYYRPDPGQDRQVLTFARNPNLAAGRLAKLYQVVRAQHPERPAAWYGLPAAPAGLARPREARQQRP